MTQPPAPPTAPPAPAPPAPPAPPAEPTFPANTSVEQMTADQQAAYWKHQSRRWEDRAKPFASVTPEQLTELQNKAKEHDKNARQNATEADRKAAEARDAAMAEADTKYRPMLAETAFRVAIGDRKSQAEVEEFIADLNLTRFLSVDGKVDTVKVLARVEQFAPAKGTPGTPPAKGPTITPHGSGPASGTSALSGLSGSDLFDKLHPKKTAASS